MLLEISGEITPLMELFPSVEITDGKLKRWSQSKNYIQLWMGLVMEVKFDAVKSNIVQEPGILGP